MDWKSRFEIRHYESLEAMKADEYAYWQQRPGHERIAPLEGLAADDFIERDKFFRLGTPPVIVDTLPEIIGVAFDGAWQRRV